jgi:hypothetical protein
MIPYVLTDPAKNPEEDKEAGLFLSGCPQRNA